MRSSFCYSTLLGSSFVFNFIWRLPSRRIIWDSTLGYNLARDPRGSVCSYTFLILHTGVISHFSPSGNKMGPVGSHLNIEHFVVSVATFNPRKSRNVRNPAECHTSIVKCQDVTLLLSVALLTRQSVGSPLSLALLFRRRVHNRQNRRLERCGEFRPGLDNPLQFDGESNWASRRSALPNEGAEVCEASCEAVCGFAKESPDFCRFNEGAFSKFEAIVRQTACQQFATCQDRFS